MAQNSYEIVAPIPVYSSDHELVSRLAKELQIEREKNFNLSRDLALEKHKTQQLECYYISISNSNEKKSDHETQKEDKKKFNKIQSVETFASFSDLNDAKIQIGSYPQEIRKAKIQKYKDKIKKYRQSVRVSRVFSGRSVIAKIKPRINGKFIKCPSSEEVSLQV